MIKQWLVPRPWLHRLHLLTSWLAEDILFAILEFYREINFKESLGRPGHLPSFPGHGYLYNLLYCQIPKWEQ